MKIERDSIKKKRKNKVVPRRIRLIRRVSQLASKLILSSRQLSLYNSESTDKRVPVKTFNTVSSKMRRISHAFPPLPIRCSCINILSRVITARLEQLNGSFASFLRVLSRRSRMLLVSRDLRLTSFPLQSGRKQPAG